MKRIALFGGTFNPIHYGHLILAQFILNTQPVDEVMFVLANIAPNKEQKGLFDPEHRFQMIKLAIKDNKKLDASDLEIQRGGVSYSIETINFFRQLYPDLSLVIGLDQAVAFKTWKDYERIFKLTRVLVVDRSGWHHNDIPPDIRGRFEFLENPLIEISSSDIRINVSKRKSIQYLLPDDVIRYIYRNKLYR